MAAVIVLLLMFALALMFLGMLYGERLSLMGWTDGEWISPIGALASRLWGGICEGVDEGIEFLLAHLSWVVAAISGTAGLILVAFLMGGGLAADASAFQHDTLKPLRSGGVLDKVEQVSARGDSAAIVLAKAERDDSQYVTQARGYDYLVFGRPELDPIRPRPRRPIDGGVIDLTTPRPLTETPRLDVTFRRLGSSVVRSETNPDVITRGRLVDDLPDPRFVDRALRDLLRDNWKENLGLSGNDSAGVGLPGVGLPGDTLPESPLSAVRELESRVRVTPGILVSEQDLRVEKTTPRESASGEITIQITVTNLGKDTIDGLLIREILPLDTLVRGAEPEGVLRDDTMTWLVNNLRPSNEVMLRFTVLPSSRVESRRNSSFVSTTEVSALAAVTTRTVVADEEPLPNPFPADRRRKPAAPRSTPRPLDVAGAPDLRMSIAEPRDSARVGVWTKIMFTLTNEGDADAEGVSLRLTLGEGLDHHAQLDVPNAERQVVVNVRRIRPLEKREFELEVRPTQTGDILSTAELLFESAQIGLETFRLVAREGQGRPLTPDSALQ